MTLRFLLGVEECRSDAALRSVDECAACMVSSCFIVETIVYTPAFYTPIKKEVSQCSGYLLSFFFQKST